MYAEESLCQLNEIELVLSGGTALKTNNLIQTGHV